MNSENYLIKLRESFLFPSTLLPVLPYENSAFWESGWAGESSQRRPAELFRYMIYDAAPHTKSFLRRSQPRSFQCRFFLFSREWGRSISCDKHGSKESRGAQNGGSRPAGTGEEFAIKTKTRNIFLNEYFHVKMKCFAKKSKRKSERVNDRV